MAVPKIAWPEVRPEHSWELLTPPIQYCQLISRLYIITATMPGPDVDFSNSELKRAFMPPAECRYGPGVSFAPLCGRCWKV
jgi:hypothetical protein